ncbi:MAG: ABC transporter substrate-binding protein [Oscillospiraceae bacterium]
MKNKIFRALSIILMLTIVLCSCTGKNSTDESITTQPENSSAEGKTPVVSISLPFFEGDSINPYFAVGLENQNLKSLFTNSLVGLDENYSPISDLAESFKVEGLFVTVSLKPALFSDGSSLSPADVIYSFNKAKASAEYSSKLSNITSVKQSGNLIIFSLAAADAYAVNLLTFPIVKNKTADLASSTPIGTGLYYFSSKKVMELNPNCKTPVSINQINLYNINNVSLMPNALEIGNINYMFEDFSEGTYKRILAENKKVQMNNFVFLGINNGYEALSSAAVRTAIYYAINKDDIASSAYQGYATAASTPFNPAFKDIINTEKPSCKNDTQKAKNILEKLGYNRFDKKGIKTNGTYNLKFSILVSSENNFRTMAAHNIANSLSTIGITAEVVSVDANTYKAKIAAGDFQLYVGEVKLTENMDLSPFFASGSASVGINKDLTSIKDYFSFKEGKISIADFSKSFMNDIPFVPLCYRMGVIAYSKGLSPNFSLAPNNIYGNMNLWKNELSVN